MLIVTNTKGETMLHPSNDHAGTSIGTSHIHRPYICPVTIDVTIIARSNDTSNYTEYLNSLWKYQMVCSGWNTGNNVVIVYTGYH